MRAKAYRVIATQRAKPMRGYHTAILLANVRRGLAASASEQPAKQRKVKHETYQNWAEQYDRECQAVTWLARRSGGSVTLPSGNTIDSSSLQDIVTDIC